MEPVTSARHDAAAERFDAALQWISMFLEGAGVAVIVIGVVAAFVMAVARYVADRHGGAAYHEFRTKLGRGILLGLELLVAADIIGTVAVEPTLENLYVLGLIVLIRTFLSISLEVEIDGRWPWQNSRRGRG